MTTTPETPTTALAPSDHHPLGPSTWPARSECAKFTPEPDVDLEDVDGDEADGQPADQSAKGRGTAMHKAVAMLLAGDLPMRQRALDGLSEREVEQVQWVVGKALEIIEANGYSQADLRVERRVTMHKPDSFEVLYFGTGDGECGPLDFDWKFAEPRNYFTQLVGYALPKMEASGETRRYGYILNGRYKRVERYVMDRNTVQTVAYGVLARTMSPHAKATPCSYCGFCARKATCEALTVTPVTLVDRREDWALKLPSPHVSALRDPAWLGAARFIWKNYLAPWGSAVEFASSVSQLPPVGYVRRPEKGKTTVGDARKAFAALRETVGEDVLWANTSITLGSLVRAHAATSGQSEAKAKGAILTKLTEAGALAVVESTSKLIADKNAEELIRAALFRGPAEFSLEATKKGNLLNNGTVTGAE